MSDKDTNILKELGINPQEVAKRQAQSSEFDSKSLSDLSQEEKELDVKLKRLELQERREKSEERVRKVTEKKREFQAKMKALAEELARRTAQQRGCSHRKGGTIQAGSHGKLPLEGGDADVYAVLKHQLPTGQWMIQCQRCAAEWYAADPFTGKPATVIGGITYKQALAFRTDNAPSKSCVFRYQDFRSDEQKEEESWKPARNERGEIVEDFLAKPTEEADGPSRPISRSR
jgi:hypothetical protein